MAKTTDIRSRRSDWWPELFPRRWFDWSEWPPFDSVREGQHMIHVEEVREGDDLVVRAEMPGIDPDKDVHVTVRDHTLEVRAERTQKETTDEKGVHRSEFRYGSFYRAIPLPPEANESDVKASYKDGILELGVPLVQEQESPARQIPIERA